MAHACNLTRSSQGPRRENCCRFKVSLWYLMSFRPALATEWDPVEKEKGWRGLLDFWGSLKRWRAEKIEEFDLQQTGRTNSQRADSLLKETEQSVRGKKMTWALRGAEGGGGGGDYSTSAFQSRLPKAGQAISADYQARCSKILKRKQFHHSKL